MSFEEKLTSQPGHLIRRCHQISVAAFLNECGRYEMTHVQYGVLSALSTHSGIDQITLAGLVAVDRSTIGNALDRLEQRNLVERRLNPADKRGKLIFLTPSGAELLERMYPSVLRVQEEILEPLNTDEKQQLMKLLLKIAQEKNCLSRAPEKKLLPE